MTRDITDAQTYACDICNVPVVITELLKFGREHVCRLCYDRAHPPPEIRVTSAPKPPPQP